MRRELDFGLSWNDEMIQSEMHFDIAESCKHLIWQLAVFQRETSRGSFFLL